MPNFYEFHDHTADIQVHAIGDTLEQAIEQTVLGMMEIMTNSKEVKSEISRIIEVTALDIDMLVVNYLTE